MTVIIGVDPGSRITGYGVIRLENHRTQYLESGCLRVAFPAVHDRLQHIYSGISEVIARHHPHEAAIEQIFMHQNPGAALKLGQARGAAIVALQLPVAEYSARQVKQSVVGYGAATKAQVQHMVKTLLGIAEPVQADAADALAIALCHAHVRSSVQVLGRRKGKKQSSWRSYSPEIDR